MSESLYDALIIYFIAGKIFGTIIGFLRLEEGASPREVAFGFLLPISLPLAILYFFLWLLPKALIKNKW